MKKMNLLTIKSLELINNGYRDIEILPDYCIRYKDKYKDFHNYITFPIQFNEIDKSYLKLELQIRKLKRLLIWVKKLDIKIKIKKWINLSLKIHPPLIIQYILN